MTAARRQGRSGNIRLLLFVVIVAAAFFLSGMLLGLALEKAGLCNAFPGVFSREGFVDCPGRLFPLEFAAEACPYLLALMLAVALLRVLAPAPARRRGRH